MKVYNSVTEMVGNTPILKLNRIIAKENLSFHLFGKMEMMNPAGSAKDRVGLAMIRDAEQKGLLMPGAAIRPAEIRELVWQWPRMLWDTR